MAWSDWINSGGLFGGYGSYGSSLDPTALDRANRYGMAAAAHQLMQSNPYDTRYGTKLFGAVLAGKMAMRDRLDQEAQLEAQKRAMQAKALRDDMEWELKRAESERKDQDWWAKQQATDDELSQRADDEASTANLWAERTGKSPEIFLGLPKVARDAEMKKILAEPKKREDFIEGGFVWRRNADGTLTRIGEVPKRMSDTQNSAPRRDLYGEATRIYRTEKTETVNPITNKVTRTPAFSSFKEAMEEAQRRMSGAAEAPKERASALSEFAAKGLAETGGDEEQVLAGLLSKGYTRSEALSAIAEAKGRR